MNRQIFTAGIQKTWSDPRWISIISGILLGLSFPPFPLPFLLFPAWLLLFRLIDLTSNGREAAFYGYISFVIWNLITTYWLMMATPIGGIAAILANSAVMTVPFALQYYFQHRSASMWGIALLQSAAWISFEFLHHHWDLAWPWLSLGNAWSNVPQLIQYISLTGYLGISFWILLSTSLLYQAVKKKDRVPAYAAIGILFLFPAISLVQFNSNDLKSEQEVNTVVVQPNFDTYLDYGGLESFGATLDRLFRLSDSVRTDSTDLIVWPESGLRSVVYSRNDLNIRSNLIKRQLFTRARTWNSSILTGATYMQVFTPDSIPAVPRYSGTEPYLFYNAGLGFQPDSTLQIYRKHNLVPIVERIPFIRFMDAVDYFNWINWATLSSYGKGTEPTAVRAGHTVTPALVCYDSVFPGWVRRYVRNGSGFLTIITNDGWWGHTSGHIQHWAYARLRAIEFRRWIVRSANNGISGIIDPKGDVKVKTDYWTHTSFRYNVPILDYKTLYARWGDWFPISMLIVTAFGWMVIRVSFSNES